LNNEGIEIPDLIVRKMKRSDVKDIARLAEEGFGGLYTFDWLSNAEALLSGSESGKVAVCVAELKEEVVGYCNLRPFSLGGWIDQTLLPRK